MTFGHPKHPGKLVSESALLRVLALFVAIVIFLGIVYVRGRRRAAAYDALVTSTANNLRSSEAGGPGASLKERPSAVPSGLPATPAGGTTGGNGSAVIDAEAPLAGPLEAMYYDLSNAKLNNPDLLRSMQDDQTLLFLGSSELSTIGEGTHPIQFYRDGYHDFDPILLGRGYMQSLFHAVNIGALAGYIPNKKVVLTLSPQWFTEDPISPDAFASIFQVNMYKAMLTNPNLSYERKVQLSQRCHERLGRRGSVYESILEIDQQFLQENTKTDDDLEILSPFEKQQLKNQVVVRVDEYEADAEADNSRRLKDLTQRQPGVRATSISFEDRMKMAEMAGEQAVGDTPFCVNKDYFETFMVETYEGRKDSAKGESYLQSAEYDDLNLFLDICRDLDLEVLLISVPVNGAWYDYIGFSQAEREAYYDKIRCLSREKNVELLDLSGHEYEPYFLRDIMHLGWKGWVYIGDAVEKFAGKNSPA